MYNERMEDRYYQVKYRQQPKPSLLGSIFRFIFFIMVAIAVIGGGLWLIGATIGLVVGLFALAIGLAPVIFVGWLIWLVIRAIIF